MGLFNCQATFDSPVISRSQADSQITMWAKARGKSFTQISASWCLPTNQVFFFCQPLIRCKQGDKSKYVVHNNLQESFPIFICNIPIC
jgi:hypothetical protein